MRNSRQLSKKMNKRQNHAEMGNPWQIKKKMNTTQHIYTKFHRLQLQLRKTFNWSLKWHSCVTKVEMFEFWDMRIENRGSRIESQESRMWYGGYVGYVWGQASSNNNKANGGKHVKPIMPLPDTKTCFNANFRSHQKLNGHIFHI